MRLLSYNIRYATGAGPGFHFPFPAIGYVKFTSSTLDSITQFIASRQPDIVGLTEVDLGSYRTGFKSTNQAEYISNALEHSHFHACKYRQGSLTSRLPIFRNQGNALLTAHKVCNEQFHFFQVGMKRLIIELEMDKLCIFLVHLSLGFWDRQKQLRELYDTVSNIKKPYIITGDFNTLSGLHEMQTFCDATGLDNANVNNLPTYSSGNPKKILDFVLYSKGIKMTQFSVLTEHLSDHLPLEFDFEIAS